MTQELVAIIGGGKFGLKALEWALKTERHALVFDSNPQAPVRNQVHAVLPVKEKWTKDDFIRSPSTLIIGDAMESIVPIFLETRPVLVIPTIPYHLVAGALLFIAKQMNISYNPDPKATIQIAKEFDAPINLLAHPQDGIATVSYAQPEEICSPNCIGPAAFCPTFHRKKGKTITQLVDLATRTFANRFLIESQQLLPGLGGIPGDILFEIFQQFKFQLPPTFIVATTCNCHGVINAFTRSTPEGI